MNPQISEQAVTAKRNADSREWMLILICFCVMAVDGFDTASIAYVAPTLALKWKISHAALTPAFVMTSIGAVIGYLMSGWLVGWHGRAKVIIWTMIAFALLSICTVFVGSILTMSITRFFTAICLGCALPATISSGAEGATEHRRVAATIVITTGLSAGTALGGALASLLIAHYGWQSVFVVGGVLPLVLLPFVRSTLRSVDDRYASDSLVRDMSLEKGRKSGIGTLLKGPFALPTLLIWSIAFLSFLVTYQFLFWMPTLLLSYGFSPAGAALGSMAGSVGGIAGNLILLTFVGRYGVQRSLIFIACVAIACMACLGLGAVDHGLVLVLVAGVGAGTISSCVGQATLAVLAYPPRLRTTGVGCAAAAGRIGAIVGPATGGALLSLGFAAQQIVLISCLPIFVTIALLVISHTASARASLAAADRDQSVTRA